ncbi:hypothetical protein HALA3H3_510075 [Halomonas sp. A3H3]|nr:hypothetical protein HALA3H3_510075 [Halomonas sp. A3H3]
MFANIWMQRVVGGMRDIPAEQYHLAPQLSGYSLAISSH